MPPFKIVILPFFEAIKFKTITISQAKKSTKNARYSFQAGYFIALGRFQQIFLYYNKNRY